MRTAAFFSLVLVLAAGAARATTYSVEADGTGDFPTIQSGINAVADGDVIELGDGVYTGTGNRDLTLLGKAITLRSRSGEPDDCVIDCGGTQGNRHRGIRIDAGEGPETVISGITIINGWAPFDNPGDWGGGILCLFASPTLENIVVRNSDAGWGGGILLWGSSARIIDCWVSENAASMNGGGIYITTGGDPILERVTVVNNRTSGSGGAVTCNASSPAIRNCTILRNESSAGALWIINDASPTVNNCIISLNFPGAAFQCTNAEAILSCCDLYGNGGGDWVSCVDDQLGIRGNISADPLFCTDYDGSRFSMHLQEGSPCAPQPNEGCDLMGAFPVGCPLDPSTVPDDASDGSKLSAWIMPNPMTDRSEIRFSLQDASHVSALVFDAGGRVVRRLLDEALYGGDHQLTWDGQNDRGKELPAGIYFVSIRSSDATVTQQVALAK